DLRSIVSAGVNYHGSAGGHAAHAALDRGKGVAAKISRGSDAVRICARRNCNPIVVNINRTRRRASRDYSDHGIIAVAAGIADGGIEGGAEEVGNSCALRQTVEGADDWI